MFDQATLEQQVDVLVRKIEGQICGVRVLSSFVASTASHATIWRPRAHIAELDGMRGLAILLVTLYRFGQSTPDDSLSTVFHCGLHGVELFFVLSGFLITGILLESRQAPGYLSNFIARRALRIFPLYFATLAAALILVPMVAAWLHVVHPFEPARAQQFYLWSYSTNIAMSIHDSWMFGCLDHFWSLAVEEHFYLVWPLFVLLLTSRQLLRFSLIGALIVTLSRAAWIVLDYSHTAPAVFTLFRCDGLLVGSAMAVLIRQPEHESLRGDHPRARWLHYLWLPTLLGAIAIDLSGRRLLMLGESLWTLTWSSLLWSSMLSARSSWQSCVLQFAPLRFLGKISYAMYVFQNPLIPILVPCLLALGLHYGVDGLIVEHLLCMAVMCLVTVLTAWLSWHGFEKHWLRLKRYFEPPARVAAIEEADRKLPNSMLTLGG